MKMWTALDVKNKFGQVIDAALVEPIVITKHGRPVVVMLPVAEYTRLVHVNESELVRRALSDEEFGYLTAEETAKILNKAGES